MGSGNCTQATVSLVVRENKTDVIVYEGSHNLPCVDDEVSLPPAFQGVEFESSETLPIVEVAILGHSMSEGALDTFEYLDVAGGPWRPELATVLEQRDDQRFVEGQHWERVTGPEGSEDPPQLTAGLFGNKGDMVGKGRVIAEGHAQIPDVRGTSDDRAIWGSKDCGWVVAGEGICVVR